MREAARRLGVTPSALSQQLARLETKVGAKLFDRTTRRMTLTAAGQAALDDARRAVALFEQAEQAAQQAGETARRGGSQAESR